jgi:hypothetical protein
VRAAVAAAECLAGSSQPLQLLHDYLTGFGNDHGCWCDVLLAGRGAGWQIDVVTLLGREARALPHQAAVWKTLAFAVGDRARSQAAMRELEARLGAQLSGS